MSEDGAEAGGAAAPARELVVGVVGDAFEVAAPLHAVGVAAGAVEGDVFFVGSGGDVVEVFAVAEDADVEGDAEVVHAVAAAGVGDAGAFGVEFVLLGVAAGAADDAQVEPARGEVCLCVAQPGAGGGLRFGEQGGEVALGAGVVGAVCFGGGGGVDCPRRFGGALEGAADAVDGAGVVAAEAQEALPVAGVGADVVDGHLLSRCSISERRTFISLICSPKAR